MDTNKFKYKMNYNILYILFKILSFDSSRSDLRITREVGPFPVSILYSTFYIHYSTFSVLNSPTTTFGATITRPFKLKPFLFTFKITPSSFSEPTSFISSAT